MILMFNPIPNKFNLDVAVMSKLGELWQLN